MCVPPTLGHLCLWQPMQRGNFSISTPGSHDCYRKLAPCGGYNSSTSKQRTTLEAGTMYSVRFQQHLNHYYPPNPGTLDISFAVGLDPPEQDFRTLVSFNDYNPMNHNTQTNFSIPIQLPNQQCDQCVLRVRYLTNNADEEDQGKTFHQCSDIQLTKSPTNAIHPVFDEKPPAKQQKNDPHDCCTPPSFQTYFIHHIPDIDYTSSGVIYYDQPSEQMRISLQADGVKYNMWMNFTSGMQYYHNVNNKTCILFGLDLWNDWCYGNTFNQSEDFLAANVSCSSSTFAFCNQWQNGDFLFESSSPGCYPAALSRTSSAERTAYFGAKNGPFPKEVFQPDPICLKQTVMKHAHNPSATLLKHLLQEHKILLD
ncbi:unnamed protein product [Didymodactylos carnosus]|uniref:Copper acquisition factor BIM1-like domain-containing protein n=1 Tax=Didymodactylos carnosus TaxID=1234261 RepID=A0A814RJU5_9BILA|nr:unnamed protein product [Didymodactylos carnosus]CAF1135073.1 unnamed protein product [Didymodactylos carnosus]CAF3838575.1 unnamed protein product [Didymodactylos carnosus]CAF3898761.1 unnamed protein product [Didymodactylos carnosus]